MSNTKIESRGHRQIPIVCPGHTRPLAEVQFLSIPDDNNDVDESIRTFLVSACHDKMPMLRDGTTGDWIGTFKGHKGAVWSCQLDPEGYLAATASGDFNVKVWDAITGKDLHTFVHSHIVKTCKFSSNSRFLATGGHEGILRIFDLRSTFDNGEDVVTVIPQSPDTSTKIKISKCIWFHESIVIASGSDGKIRFWNVMKDQQTLDSNGILIKTLCVDAEVRDMELSHLKDGRIVLTIAAGDTVSFFYLTFVNGQMDAKLVKAHKVSIHFREEGGASLHPSGKKFIAGGSDLWVRVLDFESGEELECLKGHHGPIRCVRYAPDGKTYATGSEDGTIRLWKTDPHLNVTTQ